MSKTCYVPRCKSGYKSTRNYNKAEGLRNPSLFTPPNDPELFQKWSRAIPRTDRKLSRKDKVCEVHFGENDIERLYCTILPGGIRHILKKGRPTLKKDAVPCIFPSLQKYYTKIPKKRKPPTNRASSTSLLTYSKPKQKLNSAEVFEAIAADESHDEISYFSFAILSEELSKITKPNHRWGITYHEDFIVCARWSENFEAQRKVVIQSDLSVKAFLHGTEIDTADLGTIACIEDVSKILQKIENYMIIYPS